MAGWIDRIITRLLARNIRYSAEDAKKLLELSQKGEVVIALPFKSSLLTLAYLQTAKEQDLPQNVRFIFLQKPKTLLSNRASKKNNSILSLVEEQEQSSLDIYVVPHLLILSRTRTRANKTPIDFVFGTRDQPGYLRLFVRMLFGKAHAHWQTGETIRVGDESLPFKNLRFNLRRQFRRLENAHVGPKAKTYRRIRRDTLRDQTLLNFIKEISQNTGVPEKELLKKARGYFGEIAANFDSELVRFLDIVLHFIFHRIYSGISWKPSEVEVIRKASLKGPVILLPTHKSHMDYLVLSYILYQENLMCPHIAAGSNLSFFPLGPFFRRGGAYFIRRQFKDDPLYAKVVRAYLARLLKEGFTQEFFIEGGRTRTGKVLSPKLGLLSIYLDCLCSDRFQDAVLVPTSISYDRIVESQSYEEEQSGKEKTKESASSLIQSTQVLMKRFGHVFVSFDKPIILSEFIASRNFDYQNAEPQERKRFTKALAHHIVMGMNDSVVVTPASIIALILLSAKTRAMRESRFLAQTLDIIGYLQTSYPEVKLSDALHFDTENALETALSLLAQDGQVVKKESPNLSYILAPSQKARGLNFYKNTIIHFFVNDALIVCAFLAEREATGNQFASIDAVRSRVYALSQIFKFEFIFPVDLSFDKSFASRLDFLKSRQIFEPIENNLVVGTSTHARDDIEFFSRMLQAFFETYFIAFDLALSEKSTGLAEKDFISTALKLLDTAYKSGLITKPEAINKQSCEFALLSVKSLFADDEVKNKGKLSAAFRGIADVLDALK